MNAIRTLRVLVIAEIALVALSVLVDFIPVDPLPNAVNEYLEGPGAGLLFSALLDVPMAILVGLLVALIGIYIAALVGLLLLKSWARRLYVFVFVAGLCMHPLLGATFADPVASTINYLSAACSGAIVAMLFFSEVRTRF